MCKLFRLNYDHTGSSWLWVTPVLCSAWQQKRAGLELLSSPLTHAAEQQLGLVILKGLEMLLSLSFPNQRTFLLEIRSAKLSWAAPVVHPDCPPHSFGTAGTGHPGKATPLTSLTRDGLNLLKLLQAEGTLIQSTLKWKHPLKWCYWQCYNIFRIFQTRSVYPITADPAFYFFSQCMSANINLFLLTWYKGNNRTITAALLLMNTNLITTLFFSNCILSYSKKYAGISAADTAIPVNLAP